MDIQSVRTLFELKAMQNLNTNNVQSSLFQSEDSVADTLFSDILNEQTSSSDLTSKLGAVASLISNDSEWQSFLQSSEAQSFLASNPALSELLNSSSSTENTLDDYATDYTSQTKYENVLTGASKYAKEISKAASTYDIPEKLLASVMKQESNFNSTAKSSSGAQGLMQLMPQTAKYLGVTNSLDPEQSIMGGAKYLRQLLDKFDNNYSLALAAYNAGPGNVKKYNGIPPFKETQKYVSNIMKTYNA